MTIPIGFTKTQYRERRKRNKNRQMRGPIHPKGYHPVKHEITGEPVWRPGPRPAHAPFDFADMIGAITSFLSPWRLRQRRQQRADAFKPIKK